MHEARKAKRFDSAGTASEDSIWQGAVSGGRKSQEVLKKLGLVREEPFGETFPRNVQAYETIKQAFSDFDYKIVKEADGRRYVVFENYPTAKGQGPSLADLAREALRSPGSAPIFKADVFAPEIQKKADILSDIPWGYDFVNLLLDLPAVLPPRKIMRKVAALLEAGIKGETITIFSPVCPDYATQATGDPKRPFEYTFNGLGSGVGLVAQRILKAVPAIWNFFKERAITVRFVVAIGDFEGRSAQTLERVGVCAEEFTRRVKLSQQAFVQACPEGMPIETPLMTEIFGENWDSAMSMAEEAVRSHDFGALRPSEKDMDLMCASRRPLYQRWYGSDVDAHKVFLGQIPEYMATGYLVERTFKNALILGADSIAMATFLQGLATECRPVMYLRSSAY